jgi:hypothetical protein
MNWIVIRLCSWLPTQRSTCSARALADPKKHFGQGRHRWRSRAVMGLGVAPVVGVQPVTSLRNLVGPPGFEPGTSCTPSKRASQAAPRPELSYCTRVNVGDLCLLCPTGPRANRALGSVRIRVRLDKRPTACDASYDLLHLPVEDQPIWLNHCSILDRIRPQADLPADVVS